MERPLYGESLLVANNNIEGQILAGDKTILDVFAEKSKDYDDMISGGKNIFGQGVAPLSQMELLEMIMPFAGSIRGGKVAKSTMQQLWDIAKKRNVKVEHPSKWGWSKKMIDDFVNDNAISKAKILNQKILSGKGSTGKVGKFKTDPDKEQFVDSISAILSKWSRN
jgi:hypothetical protein